MDFNIFNLLEIDTNTIQKPTIFLNKRFYAYDNILIDLHNHIPINLKPLSKNNSLLTQLNVDAYNPDLYHMHKTIVKDPIGSEMYPTYELIQYICFTIFLNTKLYIVYSENENEAIIRHHRMLEPNSFESEILKTITIKLN